MYSFNKLDFKVSSIYLAAFENISVVSLFKDKGNKIWVCTELHGIFVSNDGSVFSKYADILNIKRGQIYHNNTISIVTADSLFYFSNSKWNRYSLVEIMHLNGSNSVNNMFVDENSNTWIVSNIYTNVFKYSSLDSGNDSLQVKNTFINNDISIQNYAYADKLGFIYTTNQGIYFNFRKVNNNPLNEFLNSDEVYKIEDLLKLNISQDLSRATGFKYADFVRIGRKGDVVWFVNSSGALGVSLKDLEKFLKP